MNKKIKIIITVVIAVLILAAAGCILFYLHIRSHTVDGPGMVDNVDFLDCTIKECEFSSAGDSLGRREYIDLTMINNNLVMTVTTCEGNGHKEKKKVYYPQSQMIYDIEKVFTDYDVENWGELPDSEFIALDASTERVTVTKKDGSVFSVYSTDKLPEGKEDYIRVIYEIMNSER